MKGYLLNAPIYESFPRLFIYEHDGVKTLSGINGYMFLHFLRYMNMTWNGWEWLNKYNDSQMKYYALSLDTNTTVHMSVTASIVINSGYDVGESYPTYIVDACYIVPVKNALPDHLYIKHPFSMNLWLLLGFLVICSSLILYQFSRLSIGKSKRKQYFIYLLTSICVFLNISTKMPSHIKQWSTFLVYFSLLTFGFMLNAYYNTYLSAFLTTILYEKEVDTIEDLMKSGIKILNTKHLIATHMRLGRFPKEFLSCFEIVDNDKEDEVISLRDSLNTSYAYSCSSDRWNHFEKQQELLRWKLFRWTKICFGRYYVTYPMLPDTHLSEPLRYFSMTCQQMGLFKAWPARSLRDVLNMKWYSILREEKANDFEPLEVDFFRIAWWTLFFGLGSACVAFAFECWKTFISLFTATL